MGLVRPPVLIAKRSEVEGLRLYFHPPLAVRPDNSESEDIFWHLAGSWPASAALKRMAEEYDSACRPITREGGSS